MVSLIKTPSAHKLTGCEDDFGQMVSYKVLQEKLSNYGLSFAEMIRWSLWFSKFFSIAINFSLFKRVLFREVEEFVQIQDFAKKLPEIPTLRCYFYNSILCPPWRMYCLSSSVKRKPRNLWSSEENTQSSACSLLEFLLSRFVSNCRHISLTKQEVRVLIHDDRFS